MIAEPSTPPAPVARARRASRFAALASAAVLITGVLAGCGAGQIAETAKQHPTVGGSNADLGKIALRNMQIEAPEGGSWEEGDTVALTMTIVNNTDAAEDLIGITTDAADEVLIFADGDEYLSYLASQAPASTSAPVPLASPSASASASVSNPGVSASPTTTTGGASTTPTGSQPNANQSTDPAANSTTGSSSTSGSAGSSAAPTPSTSAPVAVTPAGKVSVPSNQAVQFGYDTSNRPVILIIGLKAPIAGGSAAELTFTFGTAGTVKAAVPVSLTKDGAGDSPTLNLHHEGGMGDEESEEH